MDQIETIKIKTKFYHLFYHILVEDTGDNSIAFRVNLFNFNFFKFSFEY